ncbi:hypothetical protein KC357_g146 [Hortaea werneckii]|nr:hypothetical protein KC357_g146 [Hortaea werneckii]
MPELRLVRHLTAAHATAAGLEPGTDSLRVAGESVRVWQRLARNRIPVNVGVPRHPQPGAWSASISVCIRFSSSDCSYGQTCPRRCTRSLSSCSCLSLRCMYHIMSRIQATEPLRMSPLLGPLSLSSIGKPCVMFPLVARRPCPPASREVAAGGADGGDMPMLADLLILQPVLWHESSQVMDALIDVVAPPSLYSVISARDAFAGHSLARGRVMTHSNCDRLECYPNRCHPWTSAGAGAESVAYQGARSRRRFGGCSCLACSAKQVTLHPRSYGQRSACESARCRLLKLFSKGDWMGAPSGKVLHALIEIEVRALLIACVELEIGQLIIGNARVAHVCWVNIHSTAVLWLMLAVIVLHELIGIKVEVVWLRLNVSLVGDVGEDLGLEEQDAVQKQRLGSNMCTSYLKLHTYRKLSCLGSLDLKRQRGYADNEQQAATLGIGADAQRAGGESDLT